MGECVFFVKSLGNNGALTKDETGQEYVVIGKGVGFGKKCGEEISADKIQRRFVTDAANHTELNELAHFAPQAVEITEQIVKDSEAALPVSFTRTQYLGLIDHMDLVLKRLQQGLVLTDNGTTWMIKQLYPPEYELATKLCQLIQDDYIKQPAFTKAEIPAIVLHIVNAENKQTHVQDTMLMTQLIAGIVAIVQFAHGQALDVSSFSYNRFIAHLQSFIIRRLNGLTNTDPEPELDPAILQLIQTKYHDAYVTVERIEHYLAVQQHWQLSLNEKVYLTLHVWRVTHR
jgi:beta-glucoside operon transcriptional antiterminator